MDDETPSWPLMEGFKARKDNRPKPRQNQWNRERRRGWAIADEIERRNRSKAKRNPPA